MDKQEQLQLFFSKSFEEIINEKMLNYDYVFPFDMVKEYISSIICIPLYDYIDYVRSKAYMTIACKEIPQYSSLDDATSRYCQILADNGDYGYKFEELGKLLLNDGLERSIGAYRKYGENHAKVACALGLSQNLYNTFYLTSLGRVFNHLNDDEKKALIARTTLRNPLYGRIFSLLESQDVNIAQLCHSLSRSTIIRRRSNVMKLCEIIVEQYKLEGFKFEHNVSFTI